MWFINICNPYVSYIYLCNLSRWASWNRFVVQTACAILFVSIYVKVRIHSESWLSPEPNVISHNRIVSLYVQWYTTVEKLSYPATVSLVTVHWIRIHTWAYISMHTLTQLLNFCLPILHCLTKQSLWRHIHTPFPRSLVWCVEMESVSLWIRLVLQNPENKCYTNAIK